MDSAMDSIYYNLIDLTSSVMGNFTSWLSVKTFTFTPVPGAYLVITGWNSVGASCGNGGFSIRCTGGNLPAINRPAHWDTYPSSVALSPTDNHRWGQSGGWTGPCRSGSNFSLAGAPSGTLRMWTRGQYAAFRFRTPDSAVYPIVARNGTCLTGQAPAHRRSLVLMQPCNPAFRRQRWSYDRESGRIFNWFGRCLSSPERQLPGGIVLVSYCNSASMNQLWSYTEATGLIQSRDGICLDVPDPRTDVVTKFLHMGNCNPAALMQPWVVGQLIQIKSLNGICITAQQPTATDVDPTMRLCVNDTLQQFWTYNQDSGLLMNRFGRCLDAFQRNQNGGRIRLMSCDGANPNQQWNFDPTTGQLKSRSGLCFASPTPNQDGGKVWTWSCNATDAGQQWQMGPPPASFLQLSAAVPHVRRVAVDASGGLQEAAALEPVALVEGEAEEDGM